MTSVYSSYSIIAPQYSKVSRMLLERVFNSGLFAKRNMFRRKEEFSTVVFLTLVCQLVGLCNSQTFLINGIIVLAVLRLLQYIM